MPLRLEHAHAESGHLTEAEAEIRSAPLPDPLLVILGGNALHEPFRILRFERRSIDRLHAAVKTEHRRYANLQM